jgi:hypothetical protein
MRNIYEERPGRGPKKAAESKRNEERGREINREEGR